MRWRVCLTVYQRLQLETQNTQVRATKSLLVHVDVEADDETRAPQTPSKLLSDQLGKRHPRGCVRLSCHSCKNW